MKKTSCFSGRAGGNGAFRAAARALPRRAASEAFMKQSEHTARPRDDAADGAPLVYGKNAVTELLKSGAAADTVFLQDTMSEA